MRCLVDHHQIEQTGLERQVRARGKVCDRPDREGRQGVGDGLKHLLARSLGPRRHAFDEVGELKRRCAGFGILVPEFRPTRGQQADSGVEALPAQFVQAIVELVLERQVVKAGPMPVDLASAIGDFPQVAAGVFNWLEVGPRSQCAFGPVRDGSQARLQIRAACSEDVADATECLPCIVETRAVPGPTAEPPQPVAEPVECPACRRQRGIKFGKIRLRADAGRQTAEKLLHPGFPFVEFSLLAPAFLHGPVEPEQGLPDLVPCLAGAGTIDIRRIVGQGVGNVGGDFVAPARIAGADHDGIG